MKKKRKSIFYLEDRYDEVAESLAENPDAEILTKADVPEEKEEKLRVKSDDWWLAEDAFAVKPSGNANPLQRQINKLEISRISDMIWINLNESVNYGRNPVF